MSLEWHTVKLTKGKYKSGIQDPPLHAVWVGEENPRVGQIVGYVDLAIEQADGLWAVRVASTHPLSDIVYFNGGKIVVQTGDKP